MADLMDQQFVALKATDDQETAIGILNESIVRRCQSRTHQAF